MSLTLRHIVSIAAAAALGTVLLAACGSSGEASSADSVDAAATQSESKDWSDNGSSESGFGTYKATGESGTVAHFHISEEPYSDSLTKRTEKFLDEHGDMHVSWARVDVDASDADRPGELGMANDLRIVTDEGKTIQAAMEPWQVLTDVSSSLDESEDPDYTVSEKSGKLEQEWMDKDIKFMPGTKGEVVIMLYAPVESVKSVWFNDEQLSKE